MSPKPRAAKKVARESGKLSAVESNAPATLGGVTGKGFMPGQSGNPAGRPKTARISAAYREKLDQPYPNDPQGRTYAQVIADRMVEDAAKGEPAAAREITDRTEGKAVQSLEVGGIGASSRAERYEWLMEMFSRDPQSLGDFVARAMLRNGDPDFGNKVAAAALRVLRTPRRVYAGPQSVMDGALPPIGGEWADRPLLPEAPVEATAGAGEKTQK